MLFFCKILLKISELTGEVTKLKSLGNLMQETTAILK